MLELLDDYLKGKVSASESGCWNWTGTKDRCGYGSVRKLGPNRGRMAHRVVYEQLVGPVGISFTLDHLCRNRSCVNPAHLEPVTLRVNSLRGTNPAAKNARKTACHRGHPFTAANTYINPDGARVCRTCRNKSHARYQQRRRLARSAVSD